MALKVSVLIVNWNTKELLRGCLDSLHSAEQPGYLQVIVVDNGSTDGSAQMVQNHPVGAQLIANETNVGFTRATNQAYAHANAAYCLMLNSDTIVAAGTISNCVAVLGEYPGGAALGCRLLNADGTHQSSIFRYPSLRGLLLNAVYLAQTFPASSALNYDRYGGGDWEKTAEVEVVMGSFVLVDRSYLGDAPLLDDGYFMYAEEADLCRRLRASGGKVIFAPGAGSITHMKGASTRSAAQTAWAELAKRRGVLRFLRKWRAVGVAEVANAILLVALFPRTVSWAVADAIDLAQRRPALGRLKKVNAMRFHMKAVIRPSILDEPWGPPPQAKSETT